MNTSQVSPGLERHSRKCSICHHPDRDAIEDEFLHWHRVIWIAQEFHIADHRSIYRHARAVGLIKARRENLHSALDNIVEQSDGIRASAGDVLRAIRAYSCLDPSTGRWTEPRKEVLVTNIVQRGTDNPVCAPAEEAVGGPIPTTANPHEMSSRTPARSRGTAEGSAVGFEAVDVAHQSVPDSATAGLVAQGFRDVCVPDASAGSPDITDAAEDPSTFSAPFAEPARRAEAGMGSAREGGPNYIAPGLEDADNQLGPSPADIPTPALPVYTGPSPEERRFFDQLAGIDHRPYGQR